MNTFTLVFTSEELNTIFNALQDRPFREVAGIIDNIRMQIQAAQDEQAEKERQETEKKEMVKEMDHMFNGEKEGDKK